MRKLKDSWRKLSGGCLEEAPRLVINFGVMEWRQDLVVDLVFWLELRKVKELVEKVGWLIMEYELMRMNVNF